MPVVDPFTPIGLDFHRIRTDYLLSLGYGIGDTKFPDRTDCTILRQTDGVIVVVGSDGYVYKWIKNTGDALQEAVVAATIHRDLGGHPNFIHIHDITISHETENPVMITMEFLRESPTFFNCMEELSRYEHKQVLMQIWCALHHARIITELKHDDTHGDNFTITYLKNPIDIEYSFGTLKQQTILVTILDFGRSEVSVHDEHNQTLLFENVPAPGGSTGPFADIIRFLNTVFAQTDNDMIRQLYSAFWSTLVNAHDVHNQHDILTLQRMNDILTENLDKYLKLNLEPHILLYQPQVASEMHQLWIENQTPVDDIANQLLMHFYFDE
jgi:hypothetical protein